jgi:hypothetical protein
MGLYLFWILAHGQMVPSSEDFVMCSTVCIRITHVIFCKVINLKICSIIMSYMINSGENIENVRLKDEAVSCKKLKWNNEENRIHKIPSFRLLVFLLLYMLIIKRMWKYTGDEAFIILCCCGLPPPPFCYRLL